MRFGPVPLTEAEGAVLAHSVKLPKGRLRKGLRLSAEDVATLGALGFSEVIAARLDPGDIGEDEAAERLGQALVPDPGGQHLKLTPAATGRVNLIATARGVVEIEARVIHAINGIDPMLTVATVPPWQHLQERGMAATIKVISYAVPGAHLQAACEMAADALRLRPTKAATAELIQTVVGADDGDTGHRAIEARARRLGLEMPAKTVVAHDVEALAAAMRAAGGDLLMVLTGSATSDPGDVAPEALRRAGGRMDHYGMPVDPGNLMFLGELAGRPVVGLPGCARSVALNGVDWILERLASGVPVTGADITAMGVGGLLKEIPSRPHPRERRRP